MIYGSSPAGENYQVSEKLVFSDENACLHVHRDMSELKSYEILAHCQPIKGDVK
jgi:hypothetical protein